MLLVKLCHVISFGLVKNLRLIGNLTRDGVKDLIIAGKCSSLGNYNTAFHSLA